MIICPECLRGMPLLNGTSCRRCATPTIYPVEECRRCRKARPAFDRCVALGLYQGTMRDALLEMKYRNGRRLVPLLGAMLAERLRRELSGEMPEAVTFVPMHRRRERERGFNQARLLAREIAGHLGLPCVGLLERTRPTRPQAGLSHEERGANVRGCMAVRRGARMPDALLLVDDILTTGATLSACAASLKKAGALEVVACVAARDIPSGWSVPLRE